MIGTPLNNNTMARGKKRKRSNSNPKKLKKQPVVLETLKDYVERWQSSLETTYSKKGRGDIIQEIKKGTEKALKHFNLKRDTHTLNTAFTTTIKKGENPPSLIT